MGLAQEIEAESAQSEFQTSAWGMPILNVCVPSHAQGLSGDRIQSYP
jgi:hypothetical protein